MDTIKATIDPPANLTREMDLYTRAIQQYRDLMSRASALAYQAAELHRIPEIKRVQALAAARLAGIELRTVPVSPSAADATAYEKEISCVVNRVCEPILTAMAQHAAENFNGVDAEHFKNHLDDAMSDTSGELTEAGERFNV